MTDEKLSPRAEVLRDYATAHGRIISPGKFEGERLYAPYLWEKALDGSAEDIGRGYIIHITASAREAFPELVEVHSVAIYEDDNGFVACRELSEAECEALKAINSDRHI